MSNNNRLSDFQNTESNLEPNRANIQVTPPARLKFELQVTGRGNPSNSDLYGVSRVGAEDGEIVVLIESGTPEYWATWYRTTSLNSPLQDPEDEPINVSKHYQPPQQGPQAPLKLVNLPAGFYKLVLRDQNETVYRVVEVESPPQLRMELTGTRLLNQAGAEDGTLNISIQGGIGPYKLSMRRAKDGGIFRPFTPPDLENESGGLLAQELRNLELGIDTANTNLVEGLLVAGTPDADFGPLSGTAAVDDAGLSLDTSDPYYYNTTNRAWWSFQERLASGVYEVTIEDVTGGVITQTFNIQDPPPLVYEIIPTNPCANGEAGKLNIRLVEATAPIEIRVRGLTNGYESETIVDRSAPNTIALEFRPGEIVAGAYEVQLTDGVGQKSQLELVELREPTSAVLRIREISPVLGFNSPTGRITAQILEDENGDTIGSNWTFNWEGPGVSLLNKNDQTLINVTPGTYKVQACVTDTSRYCICLEQEYELTQPERISFTADGQDTSQPGVCDGQITGTVNGGVPPYRILLDGREAGTLGEEGGIYNIKDVCGTPEGKRYTVTIVDSNDVIAPDRQDVIISTPPFFRIGVKATVDPDFACDNGVIEVDLLEGTDPVIWEWNNGLTTARIDGLVADTYTVVATDASGQTQTLEVSLGLDGVHPCTSRSNYDFDLTTDLKVEPDIISGLPYEDGVLIVVLDREILSITGGCWDRTCCSDTDFEVSINTGLLTFKADPNNKQVVVKAGSLGKTALVRGSEFEDQQPVEIPIIFNDAPDIAGSYNIPVTIKGCINNEWGINVQPKEFPLLLDIAPPPPLTINATTEDSTSIADCNGRIIGQVTGGRSPYRITLDTGQTQVVTEPAGGFVFEGLCGESTGTTYTINAIDSITTTATPVDVVVSGPEELNIEVVTAESVLEVGFGCTDGKVKITKITGTDPVTYNWSDRGVGGERENLPAGNYRVEATDAAGSTQTISVAITNIGGSEHPCSKVENYGFEVTEEPVIEPEPKEASTETVTLKMTIDRGSAAPPDTCGIAACCSNLPYEIFLDTDIFEFARATGNTQIRWLSENRVSIAGGYDAPLELVLNFIDRLNVAGLYQVGIVVSGCLNNPFNVVLPDQEFSIPVNVLPADPIEIDVETENPSRNGVCDGLIAGEVVRGGRPPYRIQLLVDGINAIDEVTVPRIGDSFTFNGLCATPEGTTYQIIVIDEAGRELEQEEILIAPPPLEIEVISSKLEVDFNCDDGFVNLELVSGTPPIQWKWNTGSLQPEVAGLKAGNYRIAVTDDTGAQVFEEFIVRSSTNQHPCSLPDNQQARLTGNSQTIQPATAKEGANYEGVISFDLDVSSADLIPDRTCNLEPCCSNLPYRVRLVSEYLSFATGTGYSIVPNNSKQLVQVNAGNYQPSLKVSLRDQANIAGLHQFRIEITACINNPHNPVPPEPIIVELSLDIQPADNIVIQAQPEPASQNGKCDGRSIVKVLAGTQSKPFQITLRGLDGTVVGTASVNDIGGQHTFRNLCPGEYEAVATDTKGRAGNPISIVIEEPPGLKIEVKDLIDNIDFGCSTGLIEVGPVDGIDELQITYTWADGQQGPLLRNLPAGSYNVTAVDQFNQRDELTVTINHASDIHPCDLPDNNDFSLENIAIDPPAREGQSDYRGDLVFNLNRNILMALNACLNQSCCADQPIELNLQSPHFEFNSTTSRGITWLSRTKVILEDVNDGRIKIPVKLIDGVGIAGPKTYQIRAKGCLQDKNFTFETNILAASPIEFTARGQDTSMFGSNDGKVLGTVEEEGNGPYRAILDSGQSVVVTNGQFEFINLPAGDYDVKIVDNKGRESQPQTVTVGEPDPLVIQIAGGNQNISWLCEDGSIEVAMDTGNPPITWSWSNNVSTNQQSSTSTTTRAFDLGVGTYQIRGEDIKGHIDDLTIELEYATDDPCADSSNYQFEVNNIIISPEPRLFENYQGTLSFAINRDQPELTGTCQERACCQDLPFAVEILSPNFEFNQNTNNEFITGPKRADITQLNNNNFSLPVVLIDSSNLDDGVNQIELRFLGCNNNTAYTSIQPIEVLTEAMVNVLPPFPCKDPDENFNSFNIVYDNRPFFVLDGVSDLIMPTSPRPNPNNTVEYEHFLENPFSISGQPDFTRFTQEGFIEVFVEQSVHQCCGDQIKVTLAPDETGKIETRIKLQTLDGRLATATNPILLDPLQTGPQYIRFQHDHLPELSFEQTRFHLKFEGNCSGREVVFNTAVDAPERPLVLLPPTCPNVPFDMESHETRSVYIGRTPGWVVLAFSAQSRPDDYALAYGGRIVASVGKTVFNGMIRWYYDGTGSGILKVVHNLTTYWSASNLRLYCPGTWYGVWNAPYLNERVENGIVRRNTVTPGTQIPYTPGSQETLNDATGTLQYQALNYADPLDYFGYRYDTDRYDPADPSRITYRVPNEFRFDSNLIGNLEDFYLDRGFVRSANNLADGTIVPVEQLLFETIVKPSGISVDASRDTWNPVWNARGIQIGDGVDVSFYCQSDTMIYDLTASPSGGTFAGPGVEGNTWSPSRVSQVTITLTYTHPSFSTQLIVSVSDDC